MSTPLIEQIAAAIATDIDAITVANSFNQDLTAVRPKRNDFDTAAWDDLTVLISQVEAEKLSGGNLTVMWRQYFMISAIVIDSDSAATSIDTRLNYVASDIAKKLLTDITRGGLAIDTNVHAAVPFDDEGSGLSGVAVQISVDYRTKEDDPYTKM